MYYSKLTQKELGFTNQIFSMITSIMLAYHNNHKVVVIDSFLDDVSKDNYSPISEIFNMNEINKFLKNNYDIIILDRFNINFQINSIKYGTKPDNIVDLTEYIIENFYKNDILYISKDTNFNDLKGDPCIGVLKNIFFNYKINDYLIEEIYDEQLLNDISTDFLNLEYRNHFAFPHTYNIHMFENILDNIQYNMNFIEKSENILKYININKNVNVIHLRLEEDAIKHWSRMNHMNESTFKEYIENKYIDLIQKYTSKTDQNIILSSSLKNGVIDFLIENNYNFKFNDKYFEGREKNAIVDLLACKYCNNIFIGNFNVINMNGSTFSYYLGKIIKNNITKIYIDLDRIYDNPIFIEKQLNEKTT